MDYSIDNMYIIKKTEKNKVNMVKVVIKIRYVYLKG